jgi:hypothetical protein
MRYRVVILGVGMAVMLASALAMPSQQEGTYAQTGACPSVNPVPLYNDVTVIPPNPGVPTDMAAYSGWWGGVFINSNLNVITVVESVTPPYATVVYGATDRKVGTSSLQRVLGTFEDGTLHLFLSRTNPTIDVRFALQPDGTMQESYKFNTSAPFITSLSHMNPDDPCPLHQAYPETFSLVSTGPLPPGAPDEVNDAASYLFRVAGLSTYTMTQDERDTALHFGAGSLNWRPVAFDVFIVDMDPTALAGTNTLTFSLPDGRQASAVFGPDVQPEPLTIRFASRIAPTKDGDPALYTFQVTGTDVLALATELKRDGFSALVSAPAGSTATVISGQGIKPLLVVQVPLSISPGSYVVTLILPDGRSVSASFQHTQ